MIPSASRPYVYFLGTLFLQWVTVATAAREQMANFAWFDWSILIAGTLGTSLISVLSYRDPTYEPKSPVPPTT